MGELFYFSLNKLNLKRKEKNCLKMAYPVFLNSFSYAELQCLQKHGDVLINVFCLIVNMYLFACDFHVLASMDLLMGKYGFINCQSTIEQVQSENVQRTTVRKKKDFSSNSFYFDLLVVVVFPYCK